MAKLADQQRVRAWMVIKRKGGFNPSDAAQIRKLDQRKQEELVIVRADLVESLSGRDPGMVVPIDALGGDNSNHQYLYQARDEIVQLLGLKEDEYDLLEVQSDDSRVPAHTASGYITIDEAHAAINNGENGGRPGRQDHSPGFNPWG